MALISQLSFLTLLMIICSYVVDHFFPKFYSAVASTDVSAICGHIKWAWNYLFHCSFFKHRGFVVPESFFRDFAGVSTFDGSAAAPGEPPVECAVCLSKIEDGEEIRKLRCDHFFHRVCLDRWLHGYRRVTCPLCRDNVMWPRMAGDLGHHQVIFFNYSTVVSTDRDRWWLR